MVSQSNPVVVNYTASIVFPSGETYAFSGSLPIVASGDASSVTAALLTTAMAAVSTDVVAKVTVGTPTIPSLLARQTAAHK